MFPDDDQVFPFEKTEDERTSSVVPVKIRPDNYRYKGRIMEVKSNPSSSQELRSACL